MFTGHLDILFNNVPIQIFCLFSNRVVFSLLFVEGLLYILDVTSLTGIY